MKHRLDLISYLNAGQQLSYVIAVENSYGMACNNYNYTNDSLKVISLKLYIVGNANSLVGY